MTWQHYQELKAAAERQIRDRLAKLQPVAGDGVTIAGQTISLDPLGADEAAVRRRLLITPPDNRPKQKIWIFMSTQWHVRGQDEEGRPFESSGGDKEPLLGAIYHPDQAGPEIISRAWRETYFYHFPPPFPDWQAYPWARRDIKVRFIVRVFRRHESISLEYGRFPYPVSLRLWHVNRGPPGGFLSKSDLVSVGRNGATYEPELADGQEVQELQLADVLKG